jgi:hypothetical protein
VKVFSVTADLHILALAFTLLPKISYLLKSVIHIVLNNKCTALREVFNAYCKLRNKKTKKSAIKQIVISTGAGRLAFLGTFIKLRKATISFVLSVRPSIRPFDCLHRTTRLPLDRF